ncbi:hypothetical protein L484_012754 [Morus notabilis]|uniref:Uncharacterized protein n=1 Tax=Morus notabilis TaxID=981085 RepID=W9RFY7_9ROSA|nr:uncharacterized protein LOC21395950 [Morus notabilis]EXB75380.1 hypothetical protein L484_012754 [Morus notabilis]
MSDSNIECMDSLEERVSVFFDEYSEEYPDRCFEYDQFDDGDHHDQDSQDPEERRTLYWESQHSLLQEVLERYSSTGSKLRKEISRTTDMAREAGSCYCQKTKNEGCNHCLRRTVVDMLRDQGINATLCTSKWRDTKKFPRGSHEYIEVMGSTSSGKKKIPYIVEVEFRDQFEIAKPCQEYQKIVRELPEYYLGKPDYLYAIVRIVCDTAKTSMKERKIHMGPWRKTNFMLMKWSANSIIDQKLKFTESSDKFRPLSPARKLCSQFSAALPAVVVT